MIFKIDNSQIVINGKSVLKALVWTYVTTKICKAIFKPRKVYYVVFDGEIKNMKKEQKLPKKTKVESM